MAADWCEVFAPVLFGAVNARLRAEAFAERDRLDGLVVDRKRLDRPQVVVVDDVPVSSGKRTTGKGGAMKRSIRFFVLVLAEVVWTDNPDRPDGRPDRRLRLVRVAAKAAVRRGG